jgi:membrane protein insertase Oxa1/YidC/SpoIIIJ
MWSQSYVARPFLLEYMCTIRRIQQRRTFIYESIQYGIESIHQSTHLNYWSSIVIFTISARTTLILPLSIYQQVCQIRFKTKVLPEFSLWKVQHGPILLKESQKKGLSYHAYRSLCHKESRRKLRELREKYGCPIWKFVLCPLIHIPLFMVISFALRDMILSNPATMEEGGMLWFQNLALADPTWLFPIAVATSHWINVELTHHHDTKTMMTSQSHKETRISSLLSRFSLFIGRAMSFLVFPITCYVPAGISVYWLTSSLYSLMQNALLDLIRKYRYHSKVQIGESSL